MLYSSYQALKRDFRGKMYYSSCLLGTNHPVVELTFSLEAIVAENSCCVSIVWWSCFVLSIVC